MSWERTKQVTCRGCGTLIDVSVRARPREFYCSEDCRPTCKLPGCSTTARPMSDWCWHHQPYIPGSGA
ncbi:hypothetical protein [Nakamurella endophytica]|uniref:hypothetical protein n=1 Tax=Nakamurella endophytica TaxID=1748367 RepID=UPI00166AF875|nr:hypothetical protein [Nakamurella endophytica]